MTAQAPKPCAFCGRTDVKRSREDVYPQWLSRWGHTLPGASGVATLSGNGKTRDRAIADIITRQICTGCNNGWMSDIERDMQTHFMALQDQTVKEVSSDAQLAIATWTMKTAMTVELAGQGFKADPLYQPEWYALFFKNQRPPPNCKIYISAHIGTQHYALPHRMKSGGWTVLDAGGQPCLTFDFKVHLRKLYIYLVGAGGSYGNDIVLPIPPDFRSVLYEIWPDHRTVVPWPPPTMVDERGIAALLDFKPSTFF